MPRNKKNQKKHRIFVVEDDRITRRLITRCLDEAGYESIECPEGRDAIHAAEDWAPTAMIVDVMLPDCRGPEIVEEILEDPRCQGIKVIFLTGLLANKPENSDYFFEISGKRYPALRKPINFKKLLALLEDQVTQAELERKALSEAKQDEAIADVIEKEFTKVQEQVEEEAEAEPEGDLWGMGDLEYQRGGAKRSE